MAVVRATDFQKNPGRYQDMAMREPVVVTSHGRERMVLLSIEEYRRLKQRDRQALRVEELSEEEIEAIEKAEVPSEYAHLDEELGL